MLNTSHSRHVAAACGLDMRKVSIFLCILYGNNDIFEKVYGVLTYRLGNMRLYMAQYCQPEVNKEIREACGNPKRVVFRSWLYFGNTFVRVLVVCVV